MKLTPTAAARWAKRGIGATNTDDAARPPTTWPVYDRNTPAGSGYNQGVYSPKLAKRMGESGYSPAPYYGGTAADSLAGPTPGDGRGGLGRGVAGNIAGGLHVPGSGTGTSSPGTSKLPSLGQVAPYTPGENSLVENRITGLLEAGNPYIEAARNRGLRTAHTRGLLNSSIAGQAGEAAAIEAAFPIASQDAGSFQEARMLGYQGNIQSWLAREQHGYGIGTIAAQEAASSRLSAQESAASSRLSAQEAQQNIGFEQFRAAAENEMRMKLANIQLSSEERRVLSDQVEKLGQEFLLQVSNVQRDPKVKQDAKADVIAGLQTTYQAQLESLANIYGVDIDWVIPDKAGKKTNEISENG